MFYNILRDSSDKIIGFVEDQNEVPIEYETEEDAEVAKEMHIAKMFIDTIEID